MRFPHTMLSECLHYDPVSNHFCSRGVEVKSVSIEVTVNSKEQFTRIANYVQEFSPWLCSISEDFSCTLLGKSTEKAVATFYSNI